jgi:hypothetical protein
MKNTPHIIEIDAQEAYKSIGVDLRINPFADQCVAALREHLNKCLTSQLLVAALSEAAAPKKRRRSSNASTKKTPTGSQANES